jgi:hypothetical protein
MLAFKLLYLPLNYFISFFICIVHIGFVLVTKKLNKCVIKYLTLPIKVVHFCFNHGNQNQNMVG